MSYRDIETMMLYRGIEVTYEVIRKWCKGVVNIGNAGGALDAPCEVWI